MIFPWMLLQYDVILHEEVRYVVVQVDIFTNNIQPNELLAAMD